MRTRLAWLTLAVLLMWPPLAPAQAAALSLDDLSLARIDQPGRGRIELDSYRGKPLLLLLFEDQCRYCLQALTVANALAHEDQGAWSLLAVGVGNSATALNAWAQRVQPDVPVTQADKRLLARIGGVSATPLLLVVGPEGRVVRRVLGTQDPAALRELLRGDPRKG